MRDVIASPAGPIEVAPRQLEGPRAIAYGAVLALGGIAIGLNLVHLIDLVVTSAERILHGVGAWWYGPSLLAGGLTA